MASYETPQAPTASTSRPTTIDPAARPFSIDRPSDFFALPRELRDVVYQYVFYDDGQSRLPPRNAFAALPLLTCRQFYIEAREIAFTNIRWNFNYYKDVGIYFNGIGLTGDGEPIIPPDVTKVEPAKPQPLATRSPVECTIQNICSRAGLSSQQIAAIRYLQISNCWRSDENGRRQHLLSNLRQMFQTDFQLECLTIEPCDNISDWDDLPDPEPDVRLHWAAEIAWLWGQKIAKMIVIQPYLGPTQRGSKNAFPMTIISRDRLRGTEEYFLELYHLSYETETGGRVNQETLGFDFDNEDDPLHWHWKFFKDDDDWDEDMYRIIRVEVTHGNGVPRKEPAE